MIFFMIDFWRCTVGVWQDCSQTIITSARDYRELFKLLQWHKYVGVFNTLSGSWHFYEWFVQLINWDDYNMFLSNLYDWHFCTEAIQWTTMVVVRINIIKIIWKEFYVNMPRDVYVSFLWVSRINSRDYTAWMDPLWWRLWVPSLQQMTMKVF